MCVFACLYECLYKYRTINVAHPFEKSLGKNATIFCSQKIDTEPQSMNRMDFF